MMTTQLRAQATGHAASAYLATRSEFSVAASVRFSAFC